MLVSWHEMLVFWSNVWPNDQIQGGANAPFALPPDAHVFDFNGEKKMKSWGRNRHQLRKILLYRLRHTWNDVIPQEFGIPKCNLGSVTIQWYKVMRAAQRCAGCSMAMLNGGDPCSFKRIDPKH